MVPADLQHSQQLVLVTSAAWDTPAATAQRYQRPRPGAPFRPVGAPFPVVLGRSGLGWRSDFGAPTPPLPGPRKREGDGRAPAGVLPLGDAFGYGAAPAGVSWPYHVTDPADRCVDDPDAPAYAQIVREPQAGPVPWRSAEHLLREDDQYKYLLVVTYNMRRPMPGAGSCIFWHLWRGPGLPTAGCTAMAEGDLLTLMRWLDPRRAPVVVQLPAPARAALQRAWALPPPP